jgi:hypothetical protein
MIVEWTNDLIFGTLGIAVVFLIGSYFLLRNSTHLIRRIVSLFLGLTGLWLLFALPSYEKKEPKTSQVLEGEEAIFDFLTGTQIETTDSLILKGNKHDLHEMSMLQDFVIAFKADSLPIGFWQIEVPEITENENWRLSGRVSTRGSEAKVILSLPNGDKREVILDEESLFEIESKAPSKGLYEYKISLVQAGTDTIQEILPIQVKAAAKLKMLLLAESPNFEFNYFKNYWSALGHGLLQKVRISKDKYSTSYVNMPEVAVDRISEQVLDEFDLLMLDISTWNGLSNAERNVIKGQVEKKALAVILSFSRQNQKPKALPSVMVRNFTSEKVSDVPLKVAQLSFAKEWEKYRENAILPIGFGKILVLGISDTYKLILSDQSNTYQRWWAGVISELYLERSDGFEIQTPFLTYEGQKTEAKLFNLSAESRIVLNDVRSLSLIRTPLIDGSAITEVTPKKGWNKISDSANQRERWIYAFEKVDWSAMKELRSIKYGSVLEGSKQSGIESSYKKMVAWPWWIGFALTLLGFGALWIDEKAFA